VTNSQPTPAVIGLSFA